jgi:hypothetical protein
MIFVELVDFIEAELGVLETDRVLTSAGLATGGAYTTVGAYPFEEVVRIVEGVSNRTGTPVAELYKSFGRHLFGRLAATHPEFVAGMTGPIELLNHIEHHIHVEVKKLYPDAELPTFSYEPAPSGELVMVYRSARGLGDLCEGLIRGCFDHFGGHASIERVDLQAQVPTVRFHVVTIDE